MDFSNDEVAIMNDHRTFDRKLDWPHGSRPRARLVKWDPEPEAEPERHDNAKRAEPAGVDRLQAGIDNSIKAIEKAGMIVDLLKKKINDNEHVIHDMTKTIAELRYQQDAAYQQAAIAEIKSRIETDRAQRAEALLAVSAEQTKALEIHLDRVKNAVKAAFFSARSEGDEGVSTASAG